ncbi:ester cyclase [Natronosalvus rutilus]|uniref:Ester cyclase n=1 Tax=Natronosalvus rutilus TaxID=2953753 RepID=A0A9E7SVF8_9EURY|nr:ester cyclase [Natronosalvus rutilus]UTF52243.1 ester cyclase [Natronosalvus rutilus]
MASASTTRANKELVRRFANEFVNESNYDTAREFLDVDIIDSTPLGETTGREAVVETTKELRTAFPDFVVTPEETVAEKDTVVVRMTQRGTHEGVFMGHEASGNAFEIEAMAFLRLEDGKIAERRVRPDVLGMLRQLGITTLPIA